MQRAEKQKVVAYIVRDDRLAAFIHEKDENPLLDSGLQVPEGGVDPCESIETAVLREAWEETGLVGLRIVAYLGDDHVHWPGHEPWHRHFFHLTIEGPVPDEWSHIENDGGLSAVEHPFRLFWLPLRSAALICRAGGVMIHRISSH